VKINSGWTRYRCLGWILSIDSDSHPTRQHRIQDHRDASPTTTTTPAISTHRSTSIQRPSTARSDFIIPRHVGWGTSMRYRIPGRFVCAREEFWRACWDEMGDPVIWGFGGDSGSSHHTQDNDGAVTAERLGGMLERFLFCGDDRNILSVYVQGRLIGGSASLLYVVFWAGTVVLYKLEIKKTFKVTPIQYKVSKYRSCISVIVYHSSDSIPSPRPTARRFNLSNVRRLRLNLEESNFFTR
jgi:hypothetical protein